MKNVFYLREEFITWLTSTAKLPLPSAQSYCSYVAAVDKHINVVHEGTQIDSNFFNSIKTEVEDGDDFGMDQIIITIINYLSQEGIEHSIGKPLSSISKWKTGLFQYREFLYEYIDTKIIETIPVANNEEEQLPVYPSEMFDFDLKKEGEADPQTLILFDSAEVNGARKKWIYKKEELYKIFRFRLMTQDRYYNEIFYPISFIKRLCYKLDERAFFDQWIDGLLDSTIVHFEGGQTTLDKVKSMCIGPLDVIIIAEQKMKFVFTRKADNKTLEPMVVSDLREIALDHDKPLLNIMRDNKKMLGTFMTITNELKKHISGQVNGKKLKIANNQVLMGNYVDLVNMIELKQEMATIASHTRLQLMDSRQNASKGVIDLL